MKYPLICVLLPTYNRAMVLQRTIDLLRAHLRYAGQIEYFVGDDGNDGVSLNDLFRGDRDVTVIDGPRRGLGANINRLYANATARGDVLLLQMDDDHHLHYDLDLTPHAAAIQMSETLSWIRLMQVSSHRYFAALNGAYWYVSWYSPELYIPSNRPHLKHPRFHTFYGMYPENLKLGETEEGFCHQCRDRAVEYLKDGAAVPVVGIPLDAGSERGWLHVGESWQGRGL